MVVRCVELRIRCLWPEPSESGVSPRLRPGGGALAFEQLQDALRVLPDRTDVAEHQLGRSVLRHPLEQPPEIEAGGTRRKALVTNAAPVTAAPLINSRFALVRCAMPLRTRRLSSIRAISFRVLRGLSSAICRLRDCSAAMVRPSLCSFVALLQRESSYRKRESPGATRDALPKQEHG
jgi:hypothetical protein